MKSLILIVSLLVVGGWLWPLFGLVAACALLLVGYSRFVWRAGISYERQRLRRAITEHLPPAPRS